MVVVGNFSVSLVNALTKQPFQEHCWSTTTQNIDDSNTHHQENNVYYAEIEPNLEYFVMVQIVGGKQRTQKVCVQLIVDGIQLESRTIMNRNVGPALLGVLSRKDGVTRKSALCFQKQTRVDDNEHHRQQTSAMGSSAMMGSVTVQFSDPVYVGSESLQDYNEEFKRRALKHATQINQLRSFEGTTTELSSSPPPQSCYTSRRERRNEGPSYQPGRLLEEITIKYGTKLDLIYARVVPPPPLWEFHRLKHGLSPEEESTVPQFTSKRIKLDAEYDDAGHILNPPREVELIDLTAIPLSCALKERGSKKYLAESLSPIRNPSTNSSFSSMFDDDNDSMTSIPTLISPD